MLAARYRTVEGALAVVLVGIQVGLVVGPADKGQIQVAVSCAVPDVRVAAGAFAASTCRVACDQEVDAAVEEDILAAVASAAYWEHFAEWHVGLVASFAWVHRAFQVAWVVVGPVEDPTSYCHLVDLVQPTVQEHKVAACRRPEAKCHQ